MILRKPTHLSRRGAQFIAREEGLIAHPYNDPSGYATIGVGHLLHRSRVTLADRRRWRNFTVSDAYTLLMKDAEIAATSVRTHVRVRINQAQFDALVSFTFNVGTYGFESSSLLRALNNGRPRAAADGLLQWDRSAGRVLPGLRARREAERLLFLNGRYR